MTFTVVSWNINGGMDLAGIIACLKEVNADIIGLQEVLQEEDGSNNIAEQIVKTLDYSWAYATTKTLDPSLSFLLKEHKITRHMEWGNAILSKFPITGREVYILSEHRSRTALAANIRLNDKKLTVISTHLAHREHDDAIRDIQIDTLIKATQEEYTIVAGDFNALPTSAAIRKMRRKFLDVTENSSATSGLRKIDYIFTSKEIKCIESGVIHSDASDHLPAYAVLNI